jgi:peroxiredoxin
MSLTLSNMMELGTKAPDFRLLDTVTNNILSLSSLKSNIATVVVFICNHCPYVQAVNHKLVHEARALHELGIDSVAIMPNDTQYYPEDSFENMQRVARETGYPFPYLIDQDQAVARAYGAVCTPDFFGYNSRLELQYRGRLDESGRLADDGEVRRELFEAMKQVAKTGQGPNHQVPSIGCSIKWRDI